VPNSRPASRIRAAPAASASLGNGPAPTRVRYGLRDADDRLDPRRADAAAGAGTARDRIGRGHEGIGAVVEVEQRSLRALEQHAPTRIEGLVEQERRVGDVRRQAVGEAQEVAQDDAAVERRDVVDALQQVVLDGQRGVHLLLQDLPVEQVLRADPDARRLVGVGRAHAALRRADLQGAEAQLRLRVDQSVPRHHEVRVARDAQPRCRTPSVLQTVELADEDLRVDHHPVAEHADLVGLEDARRQQVELERLGAVDDGVARVVAPLVAGHHVEVLGQQVDDLALALVAPLGAHDHAAGHQ
jgi:hypothetical protein